MPLSATPGASLRPTSVSQMYDRAGIGGRPKNRQQFNDENNRLIRAREMPAYNMDGSPMFAPLPPSSTGSSSGSSSGAGAGRGSKFGAFPGRPRMGSAAGAVGSPGTPTSQRGRFEKFGPEAAAMPTWQVSEAVRNNGGGLSGTGGLPPVPGDAVPDALATLGMTTRRNTDGSVSSIPAWAEGTKGQPIPHGEPFIAGDSTDGKPNEELILPTPEGVHVVRTKDLPRHGEGTLPLRRTPRTPRVDGRSVTTKPAPQPLRGLPKFYDDNPDALTAAEAEMRKALLHPVRSPFQPLRKYATGSKSIDPEEAIYAMYGGESPARQAALSAITGQPEPQDGEIRNGWRYDARQKRGIPLNPYLGQPNAPMPISTFDATGPERYNDLAHRLSALRQEGMSRGRAAVERVKAQQQAEEAANRLPESERVRTNIPGGGQSITGRYGTATVGRNVPKSFTVERLDGTAGQYNNLAEADVESRADAAQRRVEGVAMNTGRGVGAGAPTAIEELIGVVEPPPEIFMAPAPDQPFRSTLPDDRPSTAAGRRQAWGMRKAPMTGIGRASPVRRAIQRAKQQADTSIGRITRPIEDVLNNVRSAYDYLTTAR